MENGAEFSDSFVENLLRIIQHMRPSLSSNSNNTDSNPKADTLAAKFPGLAIPNEPQKPLIDIEVEDEKNDKKAGEDVTDKEVVDDLMAQFEADAPSNKPDSKKEEKPRRSRSREKQRRKDKERSRSRDRHRSRSKDRDRNRRRDRSRERRRNRSRSRHRRSSNDRSRRSRSRERRRSRDRNRSRDRDRNRDSMDRYVRKENVDLDEDPVPGKVNCKNFQHFTYIFFTKILKINSYNFLHRT